MDWEHFVGRVECLCDLTGKIIRVLLGFDFISVYFSWSQTIAETKINLEVEFCL